MGCKKTPQKYGRTLLKYYVKKIQILVESQTIVMRRTCVKESFNLKCRQIKQGNFIYYASTPGSKFGMRGSTAHLHPIEELFFAYSPLEVSQVFWVCFFLAISELQKYKLRDEGLFIHPIMFIILEPHRS